MLRLEPRLVLIFFISYKKVFFYSKKRAILMLRLDPKLVTAWPGPGASAATKAAMESVVPARTCHE